MAHPRHELDNAFQTPVRFSLMAALGRRTVIDFRTLREVLEAEDSALSKAISNLQKTGYVKVTKGYVGSRPRTWVEATSKGHRAYQQHLFALRAITEGLLDDRWGDRADPGVGGASGSSAPAQQTEGRGAL